MSSAALEALRERIRVLEGANGPAVRRRRVRSGVEVLDEVLGGLPVPGILELSGPEGAGRARLAAGVVAGLTRVGRLAAWVDPRARLYPPALVDHGVKLERLLIVRSPDDAGAPWIWAAEQLLRSGNFPVVVVDFPERVGVRRALAHGWSRAAEHGGCTAIVISSRPVRELQADVRIAVGTGDLVVLRDRGGSTRGPAALPPWPPGAAPFPARSTRPP